MPSGTGSVGQRHVCTGIAGFLAACFIAAACGGCAPPPAAIRIENSLPAAELARYSDPFDQLRPDLWEKAGLVFHEEQVRNYKPADLDVAEGRLVIRTATGAFSKGGVVSTFHLRGDYDVQFDVQLDVAEDTAEMDQIVGVSAVELPAGAEAHCSIAASFVKLQGKPGGIFTGFRQGRRLRDRSWRLTDRFQGGFRLVRRGQQVMVFYRLDGGEWQRADVYPSGGGDTFFGFAVQNFAIERKSIRADTEVVGRLDDFRINAARQVIESEI